MISLPLARRALSAIVCLSAVALVVTRTRAGDVPGARANWIAAVCFIASLIGLVEVARREHAAAERAALERERQQLLLLRRQIEARTKGKA